MPCEDLQGAHVRCRQEFDCFSYFHSTTLEEQVAPSVQHKSGFCLDKPYDILHIKLIEKLIFNIRYRKDQM